MNHLERLVRRMEKNQSKKNNKEKENLKLKISSVKKMAQLFRVCGDLAEAHAIQLENELKKL